MMKFFLYSLFSISIAYTLFEFYLLMKSIINLFLQNLKTKIEPDKISYLEFYSKIIISSYLIIFLSLFFMPIPFRLICFVAIPITAMVFKILYSIMVLKKKSILVLKSFNSVLYRITLQYISVFSILIIWNLYFDTPVSDADYKPMSDSELFFRQTIDNDISSVFDLNGWARPNPPWTQDPIINIWITFRTDSLVKLKQADKYIPADEEKEKFINWFIRLASDNGLKNDTEHLDSLKYVSLKRFNRKENDTKGKYFYFYNSKTKKHYLYYEN